MEFASFVVLGVRQRSLSLSFIYYSLTTQTVNYQKLFLGVLCDPLCRKCLWGFSKTIKKNSELTSLPRRLIAGVIYMFVLFCFMIRLHSIQIYPVHKLEHQKSKLASINTFRKIFEEF